MNRLHASLARAARMRAAKGKVSKPYPWPNHRAGR
jgi:hypothetical protein